MKNNLWLSTFRSNGDITIVEHQDAWAQTLPVEDRRQSSMATVAFIGKNAKSSALRSIFGAAGEFVAHDPHGQVRLWSEPTSRQDATPVVIVDCEMHESRATQTKRIHSQGREVERRLQLSDDGSQARDQRRIGLRLYARVLRPITDVLCIFSGDLGGLGGTQEALAHIVASCTDTDTPRVARCRAIIVMPSRMHDVSDLGARTKLLQGAVQILLRSQRCRTEENARKLFFDAFSDVVLFTADDQASQDERSSSLWTAIRAQLAVVAETRHSCRRTFSLGHCVALMGAALDRFSTGVDNAFRLVEASRAGLGPSKELQSHIKDLLSQIGSQRDASNIAVPLVASAFTLNSSPPGMHFFPPSQVFAQLYEGPCIRALWTYSANETFHDSFLKNLKQAFEEDYEAVASGTHSAVSGHLERLQELQPHMTALKCNKTCLMCLMNMPEKVLRCGHALCDNCIRTFGSRSAVAKYSYRFDSCLLCGQQSGDGSYQLLPPTSGVRILTLDGGGIKGIIPITVLCCIEQRLAWLACPLRDHFDLVCGTSSGGLIILGLFIMRWTAREGSDKFQNLASTIFKKRSNGSFIFSKIQQFLISYLADCKYDSIEIEKALYQVFGASESLFNPLCTDTKVAVTSTTARDSMPCLFADYNGGQRPREAGYTVVRASIPEHDISISDAARCTSAAPWYFRPKSLKHLGTFQDGGLRYNNPIALALWESQAIWPDRGDADLALSLGTGAPKQASPTITGPFSPVRDRFLPRLFRTFMVNLDGEKAWREVQNTVSNRSTTRLHRVNLSLEDKYLSLDGVENLSYLKEHAYNTFGTGCRLESVCDSILASMFYFELDALPKRHETGLLCKGTIFCRLDLPSAGRRALYAYLRDRVAFFLINGRPLRAIERVPKYAPPFRRRVATLVSSHEDAIGISLRHCSMSPLLISGSPKSVNQLASLQMLEAPFGRPNHEKHGKPLPQVPRKRSVSPVNYARWTLRSSEQNALGKRAKLIP